MPNAPQDRWLLPRHQTEYPARELVAEEVLHGRREAIFLALSAAFFVTAALLIVLGASRVIDASSLVGALAANVELSHDLRIPFGAVPFALGVVGLALVGELYGRRRAAALVAAGAVASLGVTGLVALADQLDGGTAGFASALAFATACLVGGIVHVPLFAALRRQTAGRQFAARLVVAAAAAQVIGWSAFGLVAYLCTGLASPAIVALAAGAALYLVACVVVLAAPIALIARALRLYLRVGAHGDGTPVELTRRLPAAPPRASIQPFSSAEMRFFAEGDELADELPS